MKRSMLVAVFSILSIAQQFFADEESKLHSVGAISFEAPAEWRFGTTNTKATKLFLYIPNGSGGAEAMLKVDVGTPVSPGLASNVEAMEERFSGTSRPICNGKAMITETNAATIDLPRFIITAILEGKVYFLFVAANDPRVSDKAIKMIEATLAITSSESN